MVGEIVNNIRAVLILILGLLIGLAFGFLGPVVGLGLVADCILSRCGYMRLDRLCSY